MNIVNYLRTDKPVKRNGKYPIYFRIYMDGKEVKYSTKIDIAKHDWDFKKNEPKIQSIRLQLNNKRNEIDKQVNLLLANGEDLTIEDIKKIAIEGKKPKQEDLSFFDYYLKFVERKKKEDLNKETIRVYMTTYNVLKEFVPNLNISDINLKLIEDFDDYMRDVRGNANGGRHNKHKNIRTVILDMLKHKINVDNPYDFFTIPSPDTKEVYLERDELELMRSLRNELSHSSVEYRVLQMYLFSCYCGLRCSDALDLKWRDIDFENDVIRKKQIKTKNNVITPLFKYARAVVLELSGSKSMIGSDKEVFHTYSSTTINKTLAKLTQMAGIKKHITYHTARYSYIFLFTRNKKLTRNKLLDR